jgi:chlorophyll/bacteriochlorophyll a synthase
MTRLAAAKPLYAIPEAKAALELLKPITWFPPMWAFGCGVASAMGVAHAQWGAVALGAVLCGPLVCGTSQAVNDWFDRHVDAINEPDRPIPSGRVPGRWGLYIAVGWTLLSLLVASTLSRYCLLATLFGLFLAWIYSAPPLRLKRNGWFGNAAVAICYEGLPWLTGLQLVTGQAPNARVWLIAGLYSAGAHGIMTLNDFKSIAGDLQLGLGSLPARLGAPLAARVACWFMAVPQLGVVALLTAWGQWRTGAVIALLLLLQLLCMRRLLRDPRAYAPWYNGTGVTLYVSGMLISAFALRTLGSV